MILKSGRRPLGPDKGAAKCIPLQKGSSETEHGTLGKDNIAAPGQALPYRRTAPDSVLSSSVHLPGSNEYSLLLRRRMKPIITVQLIYRGRGKENPK